MLYEVITGGSLDALLGASAASDVSMSSFDGMDAGADISAMTQMAYLYEQALQVLQLADVITSYSIHYTKLYETSNGQGKV